jgi:hypothetical protein|nr:MAG TPA: hypothetical protein [Caudoviricetes sp.]
MSEVYDIFGGIYERLGKLQIDWIGLNYVQRCVAIKKYHRLYQEYMNLVYDIIQYDGYEKYEVMIFEVDSRLIAFEKSIKRFHNTLKILLEEKGVGRK